jgi:trehalose 6-phosphate synthase/phosphatase
MGAEVENIRQSRIVVASNRLPVTVLADTEQVRVVESSGGLVSGLRHVLRTANVEWYGWSGTESEHELEIDLNVIPGARLVSVPLDAADIAGYYRDYCNNLLWPVLHGMTSNVGSSTDAWERYASVNMRFADAILHGLHPDDRLWVHDYHLLLVPRLVRRTQERAGVPVSFFLHTPFPTVDDFLKIPEHAALMHGMLGSDVIGFHTQEYAQNFRETAAALGYDIDDDCICEESRRITVTVRPMGIDADAFLELASHPETLREVEQLRQVHRRILLGVDRLDFTKGIPQRLVAFETLLRDHPELRGEISLLQIAVPTRTESAAYQDLRNVVEQLVARINSTFGTSGWTPVEYLYDSVDLHTLVALYRAADVMLVTPSRDGLNLVAKEFVASRGDGDGVLVLSKYAGAAKELTSALFVDPNFIGGLAETIYRAVTMSLHERRTRMSALIAAVWSNGISSWTRHFVGDALIEPEKPLTV